jgi:oligopeptidase B
MQISRLSLAAMIAAFSFSLHANAQSKPAMSQPGNATPPVAKKIPKTLEKFDDKRVDDYFWLREKSDPAVIDYLKAENAYTQTVLGPMKGFQDTLYQDMLSRIKETDENVPYQKGGYFYYSRTEAGKQYSIYCRKRGNLAAAEEVILDLNKLAEGKAFLGLADFAVSPDGKWLAYALDFTGFRQYTLYFRNLESGKTLDDKAERVTSIAWARDNRTVFYTTEDETTKRSNKLFRHHLGDKVDALLFEEKDELYGLGVEATRSEQYIIASSSSSETTEQRLLDADKPDGAFSVYLPRRENIKYGIDHHGKEFYISTNDKGRNYRLIRTPVGPADEKSWTEVIPHRDEVKLDGVDMFKDFFVAIEKSGGLPRMRVFDIKSGKVQDIQFPEAAYEASPGQNAEFDSKLYRFNYGSLVTPNSVFDYDVGTQARTLKKQQEVLGGYRAEDYQSERIMVKAADGAMIPVSMVYKKSLKKNGPQPLLLYGYGSYGISMPLGMRSSRLALVDRGMIYAIAHIRGGGEMGKAWHDNGKMMKKKNTFSDFVEVAEFLVNNHYTDSTQLVIQGGSAGGLLMGAVTNLRPDLFKAVVSQVPFVDVMSTMLDASLPLTVGEYLEWGNPNEKPAYDYMRAYSPYDNLVQRAYPAMLVETSLNDSQVMYWEPAKYVAKLRTLKTDGNPLLLKTNMDAGHGGASGRYDYLKELAITYSFVLSQVGIRK